MLRSIVSLAALHWREHWLREVLFLLVVAAVTALVYAGNLSNLDSVSVAGAAKQLGNTRYAIVLLWIVATAAYTLLTAFHGYGDSRRCYASLLLPACNKSKYAWEWLRTLVIFPVTTLTLIWFVDELAVKWMLPAQPMLTEISDSTGSLWDFVTAVGEPLNYIPYNIYLVVWFNAAAMLVRSGLRPAVAVVAAVAALAMVLTFQWSSVRATLYPFVWVEMEYGDAVTWSMPVTWCSRMTGYAISYVWYATLPLAIYVLSYLKFKEREI
jgi:hypothetical protein